MKLQLRKSGLSIKFNFCVLNVVIFKINKVFSFLIVSYSWRKVLPKKNVECCLRVWGELHRPGMA